MTSAIAELIDILDLERLEVDLYRGRSPNDQRQRVFGGQVAGQALIAAGRTVAPERHVHSLHAYFLRPGQTHLPIVYHVDRIRDGRSFTTRRVVAVQAGRPIFNLSASFQLPQEGPFHQDPMPEVPTPDSLPSFEDLLQSVPSPEAEAWTGRDRPIEQRFVDLPSWAAKGKGRPPHQRVWMRAAGNLPDDPLLHACVVAYASDLSLLDSVLLAHGLSWNDEGVKGASLDHAMWFHQAFRADGWLLYDQASPASGGARGLGMGAIYTAAGDRVATVVQEGLLRVGAPRDTAPPAEP